MTPYQQLVLTPSDPWLDATLAGIRERLRARQQHAKDRERHAQFWARIDAQRTPAMVAWKELVHGQR